MIGHPYPDTNYHTEIFIMQEFSRLKGHRERVNFALTMFSRARVSPTRRVEDHKHDGEAAKLRALGNESYYNGNYMKSLELYTKSIAAASSEEVLALAYGNRSAVLLKLKLYKECLSDIRRAFEHNFPERLTTKLINRKEVVLELMDTDVPNLEHVAEIPDCKQNLLIPCASTCIELSFNDHFGRHVVANRDIEVGELLSVEKPYAACSMTESFIYCHGCLEICYNMIPCEHCTKTLYCSQVCKETALNAYHKYECPIMLTLQALHLDLLPLQMIFKAKDDLRNFKSARFFKNDGKSICLSDRFKEVCQLQIHPRKLNFKTSFQLAGIAALYFSLVQNYTSFFSDHNRPKIEEKFKMVILQLIYVCYFNTKYISHLRQDNFGNFQIQNFAAGIYPFYSLFNHSCIPNILIYFDGSKLIMRSCLSIKKGEQCFVSYGFFYNLFSKAARQLFLSQQQCFTCTCKACMGNWMCQDPAELMSSSIVYSYVRGMLFQADVTSAEKYLPKLVHRLQQLEVFAPCAEVIVLTQLIEQCYYVLTNKIYIPS